MAYRATVFLDTSVWKHSIRTREMLRPLGRTGVFQLVEEDSTSRATGRLSDEIEQLSSIAKLARQGEIELLQHQETLYEIWCAEHAGATHFLTTDFKLTRLVKQRKKEPVRVAVVTPSELLQQL